MRSPTIATLRRAIFRSSAVRDAGEEASEHRDAPAGGDTDRLGVDVLVPEDHRDAAARQVARQHRVREEGHVADHRDGGFFGCDGARRRAAVLQLLAEPGPSGVLGEGAVHLDRLEGQRGRVTGLVL